jgi:ring-1,2-phenylacetyl-CoA epoxidase subunit PaaE
LRTNVRKILTPKNFYPLRIADIRSSTDTCKIITFAVPEYLEETFRFVPGQYLTLQDMIDGESVRRSYSICSAPGELSVGIKLLSGGRFTTHVHQSWAIGDHVNVMAPMGSFTLEDETTDAHVVYIAAGSGITPILSHLATYLAERPSLRCTLIYINKGYDHIIFRDELENLKDKYLDRLSIHHIFTQERVGVSLLHGRLTEEKCDKIFKSLVPVSGIDQVYLCGPGAMIFTAKTALEAAGLSPDRIHYELFSTEGLPQASTATATVQKTLDYDPDAESHVTIKLDGDVFEFTLAYGDTNILDAALEYGADLPYACKGGVCSTCKAKITNGEVDMTINYALEPDELAAGYVLTCQAHPRTPSIYVDFDQK